MDIQTDQDSGVVSYGQPDVAALAKISPSSSITSVADFDQVHPPTTSALPAQFSSVEDFDKAYPSPAAPTPGMLTQLKNTVSAFVGGTGEAMQNLGFSDQSLAELKKAGIYNDYTKNDTTLGKAILQGVLNPLAATADGLMRIAMLAGPTEGSAQSAESLGQYGVASGIRNAPQALMEATGGGGMMLEANMFHGLENKPLPKPIAEARAKGVIGEGEAGFMGTKAPLPEEMNARESAAAQVPPEELAIAQPDIHELARAENPGVVDQFQRLEAQKQALRSSFDGEDFGKAIDDKIDALKQQQADLNKAPLGADDEAIQQKLKDATEQEPAIKAQIKQLQDTREASIAQSIADARAEFQKADEAQRDIAPDYSKAYDSAREKMANPQPFPIENALPKVEGSPIKADDIVETPPAPSGKTSEAQEISIEDDISKRAIAAGYGKEEANAGASILARQYRYLSEVYGGAKGSAEQIYARESPNITNKTAKQKELASAKGSYMPATNEARGIIRLFKSADASTFVHEGAHHFMNMLKRYEALDDAPQKLIDDMATVRKWLKVGDDGVFTTKMEERFARGWETYLREGHAPSKELIGVFQKYSKWLRDIYDAVGKKIPYGKISPDVKNFFDRVLEPNAEKRDNPQVAAEREPGKAMAVIHTADAKETTPQQADAVGDTVEREIDNTAKRHNPEIADAIKNAEQATSVTEPITGDTTSGTEPEPATGYTGASEQSGAIATGSGGPKGEGSSVRSNNGSVYRRVPAEPLSLADWVRKQGGMMDEGKDIQNILGEKKLRGGKVSQGPINKNGIATDDMAERAGAAGYFPEKGGERPTINEFIDKLTEDLKGNKQYSENDESQAAARLDAMAHNSEVDRIAGELSIDPKTMSKDQFWNTVAEKESRDKQEQMLSDMESAGRTDESGSVLDSKGNPKYDLIEKRIDKINTPDDVDNFIREAAAENDAFSEARRGVVSQAQTMGLAEAMGVDGNFYDVLKTRKVGEAYNAHQLKAAEALFKTLSTDAFNKSRLPKSPENIAAFEAANQKFLMATSHFMAASSEAGRALNILRNMSEGLKQAKDVQEFFQKNTGKTAAEIGKQMDFMSKLENGSNQAAFIKASQKAGFKSMMLEYYVNCLISGPLTHMRYTAGNMIKAIETPLVEIPFAAAHGSIRAALGKEALPDRVYWGEATEQLYALGKGSTDGLRAAAAAWNTSKAPYLPGEVVKDFRPNAIPGTIGKIINVPSKSIEAIHAFSKTMRYTQNIAGLAYRIAAKEGLNGDVLDRRVAELTKTPTDIMMKSASADALKELYMAPTDYNSPMGNLIRFTNSSVPAKIVLPFMKIGSQITREAFIERTPLGLVSQSVRDNLSGKNGGAARDMQMGKMVAGTALISFTSSMVLSGNATGDGPSDPKQRDEWLLTHRPNTLTIGDINIPYQGLGSLGMLMRFSANMTECAHAMTEDDGDKLGYSFLHGITASVLDDNWMRGMHTMLDAMYDEKKGQRYIQDMAANWLPFSVGMGQVAREIDPDMRMIRDHGMDNGFGILDALRAKIPVASEGLFPRRDVFGQPIPNGGAHNYDNDPVVQRLDALRIFPSPLQRKIRGVQLTDQQYDDYSNASGVMVKTALNRIVGMPNFSQMTAGAQIEMINQTIKSYRENARTAIMMKYPDIMKAALAAKQKDNKL